MEVFICSNACCFYLLFILLIDYTGALLLRFVGSRFLDDAWIVIDMDSFGMLYMICMLNAFKFKLCLDYVFIAYMRIENKKP